MKQLANWRGARVASLIPNVLPKAEAAACIEGGGCWCEVACSWCASCNGNAFCYTCYGRVREECRNCCEVC